VKIEKDMLKKRFCAEKLTMGKGGPEDSKKGSFKNLNENEPTKKQNERGKARAFPPPDTAPKEVVMDGVFGQKGGGPQSSPLGTN